MTAYNVQFGNRLRRYRRLANLTQKELAEKLGLTESTINKYENGKVQSVDIDFVKRIAYILKIQPEVLMGWETENTYYLDDDLVSQMQKDYENPETRFLMDASRKLSKKGYDAVKDFIRYQLEKEGQLDD